MALVGCLVTLAPAFAQEHLKTAPTRLTLQVTSDPPGEQCRRIGSPEADPLAEVSLHRTFHDDFDETPSPPAPRLPPPAAAAPPAPPGLRGRCGPASHRTTIPT